MKRRNPKFGGPFSGGGGQGWKAKRARPDGRGPVVRWSHEEAMKKRPAGGGDAVVAGAGGGGWSSEVVGRGKAALGGGPSCGSGGFWTSWAEAAAPAPAKADDGTATRGGKGGLMWDSTEPDAKKAGSFDAGGGGEAGGDGEEGVVGYEWRWTEAVSPEILALVLRGRVAADEVARGAAQVCRAWRQAAASPDMWGDVDIEAWCRRVNCRARADAAVRRLVARAQGTLRRLSAYRVGDASLTHVAASGKLINVLQIPMSEVTDQAVEKHAECLPALKVLDISYCLNITSRGIEALGQHCKLLVQLKRNMPPPEPPQGNTAAKVVEEEAMAVANTMPRLEQLELAYGLFSDLAVNNILNKCPLLRMLNILGCWNVRLEGDIEERCCALQSFREPWEPLYSTDSSSGGDYDDINTDPDD